MAGYPITLQLNQKPVLIVGGGKVAARKVPALLSAGAKVTIISPLLHESLSALPIEWINAEYQADFLVKLRPVLLFAATNNPEINQAILRDARHYGIFINMADESDSSDFHNMALLEKPPFTIAMSSNAVSPALLVLVRERISAVLSDGLITLANWLGDLRSRARGKLTNQEARQALYQRIIASDVLSLLESGDSEAAQQRFNAILEEAL